MITLEQQKKGSDLMENLIRKSWESEDFKKDLINNPAATIKSFTNNASLNSMKILVEDQSDSNFIFINIPKKLNFESIELTDEQLEIVSGGEILASVGVGALIVGAGLAGAALGYGICAAID